MSRSISVVSARGAGLLTLVVVFCAAAGRAPGAEVVAKLNEELFLGTPLHVENVTVWPVYSTRPAEKFGGDLLTLADAQEKKLAVVRERGAAPAPAAGGGPAVVNPPNPPVSSSANPPVIPPANPPPNAVQQAVEVQLTQGGEGSARVNELVIENSGTQPVLVLAGTLVRGGKQDRQIAQDFIVPPGQTVPVGAFCVEHGRWTAQRGDEQTAGVFKVQPVQANLNVRNAGEQGAVWEEVAKSNSAAGKSPGSGTFLATVEETDPQAVARRAALNAKILERFAALAKEDPAPIGLAYAVNGKAREIRTFSHPQIFQRSAVTLSNTVALEGDLAQRKAKAANQPVPVEAADAQQAVQLVQKSAALAEERQATQGGNDNGVRKSKEVMSRTCYPKDPTAKSPATQSWSAASE